MTAKAISAAIVGIAAVALVVGCQSAACDDALETVDGSCRDWVETAFIGQDAALPTDIDAAASPVISEPRAPRAVLDAQGEGLAIWSENGSSLWASRFTPTDGWQQPLVISEGQFIDEASIVLDLHGDGLAVWREKPRPGVAAGIWASSFSPEGDWLLAEPLHLEPSEVTQQVGSPSVATDEAGRGVAVWSQRDDPSGRAQIWSNTYSPMAGWGAPQPVDPTGDDSEQFRPRVVLDGTGNGFAVWIAYDPTAVKRYTVWASRFTPGGDWDDPERLDSKAFGSYINSLRGAQLGADDDGGVVAVWGEQLDNREAIVVVANRFDVESGWTGPKRLGTEADASSTPRLSVDPSGNAVAVWRERRQPESIWASYYSMEDGWREAKRIGLHAAPFDTLSFDVVLSEAGNAIAAWVEPATLTEEASVWVASFNETGGWREPRRLELVVPPLSLSSPSVALDPNGNAVVVWQQADAGGLHISASRFE